jgi:prophage regulatory protein
MTPDVAPRRSPHREKSNSFDKLPTDLTRFRVMGVTEAAAFFNYSIPHFRRLYRNGRVPPPLRIGERKLGWRVGDCIDFLEAQKVS